MIFYEKPDLWEIKDQYFEVINDYGKSIKNYVLVIKNINKLIYTILNENDIIYDEKLINIDDNNFTINIIFSEIYNSKNILQSMSWMPFTKANKIKKYEVNIINFITDMINLNEVVKIRTKPMDILTFRKINIITDFSYENKNWI